MQGFLCEDLFPSTSESLEGLRGLSGPSIVLQLVRTYQVKALLGLLKPPGCLLKGLSGPRCSLGLSLSNPFERPLDPMETLIENFRLDRQQVAVGAASRISEPDGQVSKAVPVQPGTRLSSG